MPLLLYITVTVILQPIMVCYKIIGFMGSVYSLQGSEERLGYIKPKCVYLEVLNYYDQGNVRYIEVRCKLGYMTHHGCPRAIRRPSRRTSRSHYRRAYRNSRRDRRVPIAFRAARE